MLTEPSSRGYNGHNIAADVVHVAVLGAGGISLRGSGAQGQQHTAGQHRAQKRQPAQKVHLHQQPSCIGVAPSWQRRSILALSPRMARQAPLCQMRGQGVRSILPSPLPVSQLWQGSTVPSGATAMSDMAVAPDGTVLPCQSWLTGKGLGNMLRTPWPRIWHSGACRAIRGESAKMERRCQLGATPMQEGC